MHALYDDDEAIESVERDELADAGFFDQDLTDDPEPDQDVKPDPGSIGDQLADREIQEWSMKEGWL